nr:MAG TPA: hypothetical protein [Caudoviricetes sp.]
MLIIPLLNFFFISLIYFFIGGQYYVKRKTKQHYRTT